MIASKPCKALHTRVPCDMQGVQGPLMRARVRARAPQPRIFLSARCMASNNSTGNGEKSWGDIAGDALQVARNVVDKATRGVSDTLGKLLPRGERSPPRHSDDRSSDEDAWQPKRRQRRSQGGELYRPADPFGGGLLGRAAGSMLGGMFGQLGEMMAESNKEAASARDRALAMIQDDPQVRSELGAGVRVVPGMDSQSTSTSMINGRTTRQTSLGFLVAGSAGRTASAQADVTSKPDGSEDVRVVLRLPDGRSIRVEGGGNGGGGGRGSAPIDVEWREVR